MNKLSAKALAYVPDRILVQLKKNKDLTVQRIEKLCGAVIFLDMVGFTSLTEALVEKSLSSDRSAEVLQEILTEYYNHILAVMRNYGGFAYQFAGDSVLVGLVCEENEDPHMCAIRAAKCALQTQKRIHDLNKSKRNVEDIKIGIKISLSYGNYFQIALGAPDQLVNSTIIGSPVDAAVYGEKLALSGDVIVSKAIWQKLPENKTGIPVETPHNTAAEEYFRLTSFSSENHIQFDLSVFEVANLEKRIYQTCSRFMPAVLYNKILDGHEHFIGDFREVTTLFVGFRQDYSKNINERVMVISRFFEFVHRTSLDFGGALVQIDFTDKGNVFLILFGAPAGLDKKEIMAARFALKLKDEKENHPDILNMKIGITTGKSYCGDLGAEFRKGYTVVSKSVNIAARLITFNAANSDDPSIHLDAATRNGLTKSFKTEFVESTNLKGIKEAVSIYSLLDEKKINRSNHGRIILSPKSKITS